MRFKISATSIWETNSDKPSTKIVDEYPCLADFAFECVEEQRPRYGRELIRDETGKLIRQITYEPYYQNYINIDTIEQLVELIKTVRETKDMSWLELVVSEEEIEIYDTYRE